MMGDERGRTRSPLRCCDLLRQTVERASTWWAKDTRVRSGGTDGFCSE